MNVENLSNQELLESIKIVNNFLKYLEDSITEGEEE